MTKQEILAELRKWRDKKAVQTTSADGLAEKRGQEDDYMERKAEADRLYDQWRRLRDAVDALADVDD